MSQARPTVEPPPRTFTREQVDQLLKPMLSLISMNKTMDGTPTHFRVPVGHRTSVSVKFEGPVGMPEYDRAIQTMQFFRAILTDQDPQFETDGVLEQIRTVLQSAGFSAEFDSEGKS